MTDLKDYSGEFEAIFGHETFTRETLFKLLKFYAECLKLVDGIWYSTVVRKWGGEEALECDTGMLKKARAYEAQALSELLNIRGDDVAAAVKFIQLSPWVRNLDFEIDLKDNDHAVYTVRACPTLAIMERDGRGDDTTICLDACIMAARVTTQYCNQKIDIAPLKLAPRENEDDICCRWEFKLER
ncbi:DUF6125 family protein [Chloroflexota bacterium]